MWAWGFRFPIYDLRLAGVPASDELAIGEEQPQPWFAKEQAGEQAAPASGVFVLDMFSDMGAGWGNGRKLVSMLPQFEGALQLGIGESILAHLVVDGCPTHRDWPKPDGELRHRVFAERIETVKLDKKGRGHELFEDAGVVVEAGNGRKWGIDCERIIKSCHNCPDVCNM